MKKYNRPTVVTVLGLALVMSPAIIAPSAFAQDAPQRTATHVEAPRYPRGAERREIEGSVTIAYSISAEGEVLDAVVSEANPAGVFDRAALAAVEQWRYEPHNEQTDGHRYRLAFQLN